jgi:hypothetical protein
MRELFTVMAETADVPYPASAADDHEYARVMTSRLGDLKAVLGLLSREPQVSADMIRGQIKLLREWAEMRPVTYDSYVPDESRQEKS